MNKLLTIFVLAFSAFPAFSYLGESFEYNNVLYTVIDESNKFASTKEGIKDKSNITSGNDVTGNVDLESTVYNNGTPYTLVKIGDYSFYQCDITSISIPSTITEMGVNAFNGNSKLSKVEITDIASWCSIIFDNVGSNPLINGGSLYISGQLVTDVKIPNNLTQINDFAFYTCAALTNVEIGNSVTAIGKNAFYMCPDLTTVKLPKSVNFIDDAAFESNHKLQQILIEDIDAWCNIEMISNPFYSEYTLHRLYLNNQELESIVFPTHLTEVKDYTFASIFIKDIQLHNSITKLGISSFRRCSQLTNINLPGSLQEIGEFCFNFCIKLQNVSIPNSVTLIGREAFSSCESLESVNLSSALQRIERGTFSYCRKLKNISIPTSVTEIGETAFYRCKILEEIDIPFSVTQIEREAFNECDMLKNVKIGNSKSLKFGQGAFRGCKNLTNVSIQSNSLSYDHSLQPFYDCPVEYMFVDCEKLESYIFKDLKNLKHIVLGNKVYSIDQKAFSGCAAIEDITIGNSLDYIPAATFANLKSLKSLTVGYGLRQLGATAFENCPIEKIYITTKEAPAIETNSFSDFSGEIYTLTSAKSSFTAAKGWSNFTKYRALVSPNNVSTQENEIFGYAGQSFELTPEFDPINTTLQTVFWYSDDNYAASVDINGRVTINDPYGYCNISLITLYPDIEPVNIAVNGTGENPIPGDSGVKPSEITPALSNSIYTINGILIKRNATADDVRALSPGLYIINGKKHLIK